MPEARVVRS